MACGYFFLTAQESVNTSWSHPPQKFLTLLDWFMLCVGTCCTPSHMTHRCTLDFTISWFAMYYNTPLLPDKQDPPSSWGSSIMGCDQLLS